MSKERERERAKSRPGQIDCNDFYCCISISFSLSLKRKIQVLAAQILHIISNAVYVSKVWLRMILCVALFQNTSIWSSSYYNKTAETMASTL